MEDPTEWPYNGTWAVKEVTYVSGDGAASASLVLTVVRGLERHRLTFSGVKELRFAPVGSNFPYGLRLFSIAERQLEKLRYKATTGQEPSTLEFYCQDAVAVPLDTE